MAVDRFAELRKKEAERLMKLRANSVTDARAKFAMKKPEPPKVEPKARSLTAVQGYSKDASQLTPNQLSNIKVNPKNPLTIVKPLRPNILDQMAVENVNWLAAQRRRAGIKWVPVQQF
jgi:hypothetical protein